MPEIHTDRILLCNNEIDIAGGHIMAYPRPLSEKTIAKMLTKEGITEKKSEFLHRLFLAAAKLYGVIDLEELWTVYKETAAQNKYPKITRKEYLAFSLIARREDLIYRIYEVDELYSEDERDEMMRLIVLKDLKTRGGIMQTMHYIVAERSAEYPLYIPEDILSFDSNAYTAYEKDFLEYLEELPCRQKYTYNDDGRKVRNENYRKKLKEITYADSLDRHLLQEYEAGMKTNPGYYRKLLEEQKELVQKPVSQRLFDQFVRHDRADWQDSSWIIGYTIREISEYTGELKETEYRRLVSLMSDLHNHSHLYSMHGWSPDELHRAYPPGKPKIAFGPGIKQMIQDGTYDRAELERMVKEAGLEVFDPDSDKNLS